LKKAKWLKSKAEAKAISDYYKKQIVEINAFYGEYAKGFTEIETQVHSLRRKLRWLSIYPQTLQGGIQLLDRNENNETLAKYLVPEIVNSPYNKMPDVAENKNIFVLNKNYFLALSWLISELGKIKDEGLRIYVIAEALENTKKISHSDALNQAVKLATNSRDLNEILSAASNLCQTFFAEKNLDKLIFGAIKAKIP
jgi:hypothetical protein